MSKNKFNIVGIIPARSGSKRLPHKNIRILVDKPLIAYTIEAALKSKYINRVIVSTDDDKISRISKNYGAEIIVRPKKLAEDDTPMVFVLRHAIECLEKKENYRADAIVLLQPTSPLRTSYETDMAIKKFLITNADLVVSVSETKNHPFWSFRMDNDKLIPFIDDGLKITRRQDLPKIYVANGTMYVMSRETLQKENIYDGDVRAIIMDEEKSIDIDTMLDFKIAELLIKTRKNKK
jgi:CMP-N-acetylneuraminic acid synthetase